MTAKEVREFRNVCKKLADVEERSKLLDNLKKNRVCLASEEGFVLKPRLNFFLWGARSGGWGADLPDLSRSPKSPYFALQTHADIG